MKLPRVFSRGAKRQQQFPEHYHAIYAPSIMSRGKDRLVLLECSGGKTIDDSPLAIAEALSQLAPDFNIKFSTTQAVTSDFEQVARNSAEYWTANAQACAIVGNNAFNQALHKHPDQLILQTWDGAPIKKIGYDVRETKATGKDHKARLLNEVILWDALLSPSRYFTDIFRNAFGFTGEVLEFGSPRNDVLCNHSAHQGRATDLRKRLGIPQTAKIVLHAPTSRDDQIIKSGLYGPTDVLDIESLSIAFPDVWFLYRGHHLQDSPYEGKNIAKFLDVSGHGPITDLYLIADILVSDYSSVMVDYSLLNRPIIRYVPDLDRYMNNTSGFYCDFQNDFPMPLCKTAFTFSQALQQALDGQVHNELKWVTWRKNYLDFEHGNAATKTAQWILDRVDK